MKTQRVTFVQKVTPRISGHGQTYLIVIACGFLTILSICVLASPVSAQQRPAVSINNQVFSFSYEDCLARAKRALESEGFTAERGGDNFYWGGKGIHHATIVCDGVPDKLAIVHIFVASTSGDGNVPGAERVKLQAQMDRSSPDGCGLGVEWSELEGGFTGRWIRRGDSNIFDAMWGGIKAVLNITRSGNSVRIERRQSSDGNDCDYTGAFQPDGITVRGVYTCKFGAKDSPWSAAIRCNTTNSGFFTGTWHNGNWGYVRLQQNGDQIAGTYSAGSGGKITGTATGKTLRFSWERASSGGSGGEGIMTLKENGNIEGYWCEGKGCDPTGRGWFEIIKQPADK